MLGEWEGGSRWRGHRYIVMTDTNCCIAKPTQHYKSNYPPINLKKNYKKKKEQPWGKVLFPH